MMYLNNILFSTSRWFRNDEKEAYGMNDEFGVSGPAVDLLKKYGLCAENIAKVTKEALNNK